MSRCFGTTGRRLQYRIIMILIAAGLLSSVVSPLIRTYAHPNNIAYAASSAIDSQAEQLLDAAIFLPLVSSNAPAVPVRDDGTFDPLPPIEAEPELPLPEAGDPTPVLPAPANPHPGDNPLTGPALVIYTDEFRPGWREQWDWSVTIQKDATETVYSGSRAMALTFTEEWGGFATISDQALPISEYQFVQFWINSGPIGLKEVSVSLVDENKTWGKLIPIHAPTNRWTRVTIPIAEFGYLANIKGIVWHDKSGLASNPTTIYLDEIRLFGKSILPEEKVPGPTPKPITDPYPAPQPTQVAPSPAQPPLGPTQEPTAVPPVPTNEPIEEPKPEPTDEPVSDACLPMMMGVNLPVLNRGYGADFGTVEEWGNHHTYNHADAKAVMAELAANGANSIRWWVFFDGRGAPEFDTRGYVTGLDHDLLPSMADALMLAAEYDIIINFTLWSFEMLAYQGYGDTPWSGSHGELYYDDDAFDSFIQNALIPMASYPTPDGYTIASHPNTWFDIINEPEWGLNDVDQPPNPDLVDTISTAQLQKFVAKTTGELHRQGATMVGVGQAALKFTADESRVLGAWGDIYADHLLQTYDPDGALDYYSPHYYPWMDGDGSSWNYNPFDYTKDSLGINKPVILGEISAHDAHKTLERAYEQGYDGAWIWTYEGVDGQGSWSDAKGAFQSFAQNHPEVYRCGPGQ